MIDRLIENKYNNRNGELLLYIGRDGKDYNSLAGLLAADERWKQTYQPFIGADGKDYGTRATLEAANSAYCQSRRPLGLGIRSREILLK